VDVRHIEAHVAWTEHKWDAYAISPNKPLGISDRSLDNIKIDLLEIVYEGGRWMDWLRIGLSVRHLKLQISVSATY